MAYGVILIRISHCCAAALLVRAVHEQNASSRIVLGTDNIRNILKISHEAAQFEISRMQRLLREIFADEALIGNGRSENH
ncbi:hypothetical protein X801_08634 [Opisthorchis viverrini]|uniref:Uncharacterized protein n=1 Tax=Opisthorchis viverrini TaxID=6198 RepID=A0A1S8WMF7_OPIVI|nr:hypothetical protein X801_08634 [Opisthorchis viverrini]